MESENQNDQNGGNLNPQLETGEQKSSIWRILLWLITIVQIIVIVYLLFIPGSLTAGAYLTLIIALISIIFGNVLIKKGLGSSNKTKSIILVTIGLILSTWIIAFALFLVFAISSIF